MVGAQRIFVPGVRAVIVNQPSEILLQRRTDSSLWGLPGGAVELNETVYDALEREVLEETGLTVVTAHPMGLYSGPNQQITYPNGDEVQCFALAFIVSEWTGRPRADGREGSDVRFFPLERLPAALVPIHRKTIEDYAGYDGTFLLSG